MPLIIQGVDKKRHHPAIIRRAGGRCIVILETHKSETIDHDQLAAAFLTHDETRIYGKAALHFFRASG